jgi:hypothetical protein
VVSQDHDFGQQPEPQGPQVPQVPYWVREREEARRKDAMWDIRISDLEAQALAMEGQGLNESVSAPAGPMGDEEWARFSEEERRRREKALQSFKAVVLNREIDAYLKGVDSVTDRAAVRAYNTRSIVLLLVVLAVVAMPIIAILLKLAPADFGTFIAPVTGIAGTVVGYWFGSADRPQK